MDINHTNKPLVSIVIFSWNRKNDILRSLSEINRSSYKNLEIILVDNGSTDGTINEVQKKYQKVKIIALKKNIDIAAYNYGFAKAAGKYILILDDDSFPAHDAIQKAVTEMEKDENVVGIAFNINNPKINGCETICWPSFVYTFVGCGAMVRSNIFKKAGFYDPDFFLYCNELDVTIRMLNQNNNFCFRFFPKIVSNHMISAVNRSGKRRAFYELRNNLWIIWRYFPPLTVIRLTARRIIEEFVFMFTWHKSFSGFFSGLLSAISGAPHVFKKRIPINDKLRDKLIHNPTHVLGQPLGLFLAENFKSLLNKLRSNKSI